MKSGYVAIIGVPNVGKSTLINRFVGEQLAIVTDKPQTTRQKILGIYNSEQAQIVFLDTPGFHESDKAINKFMMEEMKKALDDADMILFLLEPDNRDATMEKELFRKCREIKPSTPVIVVINKIDTVMSEPWGKIVDKYYELFEKSPTVAISAARGDGCPTLLNKILEMLPEGEKYYPDDIYTEHPVRFLVSEIIREQAMLNLHQEVPYSLAVEIESFKEPTPSKNVTKIRANIVVEKDSQKKIVIGAKGSMIKKIGEKSRAKIEPLVGGKVYLELYVKVVANWTKSESAMKNLGYGN